MRLAASDRDSSLRIGATTLLIILLLLNHRRIIVGLSVRAQHGKQNGQSQSAVQLANP
jgi:hypothetical protein